MVVAAQAEEFERAAEEEVNHTLEVVQRSWEDNRRTVEEVEVEIRGEVADAALLEEVG